MDWTTFPVLLGGLGIGSLLTTVLQISHQDNKDRKNRIFREKKIAYLRYIKVIPESQTMENKKAAGWQRTAAMAHVKLFGSEEVLKCVDILSKLHHVDLTQPLENLFKAMREDLHTY